MPLAELDAALQQSHAALSEIINGNAEPFMVLYSDHDDVTLGNPFGPFVHGKQAVREAALKAAGNYRDGEVLGFERAATHIADSLACVVEVERFRAKVGDSNAPASVVLRVTSVYRDENGAWRLVHRHADPIVAPQAAESVIQK